MSEQPLLEVGKVGFLGRGADVCQRIFDDVQLCLVQETSHMNRSRLITNANDT